MVRTLPQFRPFDDLDAKRIAGNTLVVILHALVFALLMMPGRWQPPAERTQTIVVEPAPVEKREIPKTEPPPEPVRLVQPRPEPRPQPDPPQIVRDDTPPVETQAVFETGEILAQDVGPVGPPVTAFDAGPQLATLTYAHNPAPRYPRRMIQAGAEGEVVLRVLVDATGKPLDVTIERSSGHRELDKAAREQVLSKWRFNPAEQGGVPVPAYALVPIAFTLP